MKKDAARDALVQEARELLVAMEAALLQIENDGPSKESINAIFRAAHTIKGSAGLFAFDSIVNFTHVLENVLDKVRNSVLALDDAMMSLLLDCGDYIGSLVDAIEQLTESEDPDPVRRAELETALNQHLSGIVDATLVAATAPPGAVKEGTTAAIEPVSAEDETTVANPCWHLSLRFSHDVLKDGLDPLSFLRYLTTLGEIVYCQIIDSDIPAAEAMDAEVCYLGFEIGLATESTRENIESVFEFVRDGSQIVLLAPHCGLSAYRQVLAGFSDPATIAGSWLASGALTVNEWRQLERAVVAAGPSRAHEAIAAVGAYAHVAAVTRVKPVDEKKAHEQKFIKIEVSKLDQLIDLVGELVIAGAGTSLIAKRRKDVKLEESTQLISGLVEQIRDAALTLRMVQINEVFQRFPRVVRDISREMGKDIELIVTGAETELDKSMVEKISDPLMHIVRNAMDHGIESAAQRVAAGKSATGTLRLNATHESGSVVIEVVDDGRGLDKKIILQKAIEQGLVSADAGLSEGEIFRLIFEPGFSTATEITALSGRGVGMDVVKRNIDSLHGEVDIFSAMGRGTMVRIRLPLTLAIISGFQVMVGGAVFVIPLDLVIECINLTVHPVHNNIVTLRGEPLPFVPLRELFELPQKDSVRKSLVIVQYGQQRAGLLVDGLLGECQAVIKPLGSLFSQVKGLSGSTILGDGRVALILDIPHLIQYTRQLEQMDLTRADMRAGE